ncbi:ATP-binding protein, partial [Speluncibacter jeojiensis]|nr:LuxR C-terminal-related transcriptional regulator [Corynebacteriales bacterium D3-21]
IDHDLADLIEHTMARDPKDRPATTELAHHLRQLTHEHTGAHTQPFDAECPDGTDPQQVSIPKLPVPTRLPEELTSFVGRRSELTAIRNALGAGRLVTLTGIGGVGKTRLALRTASTAQRSFPDGIWLVEFAEIHDPASVVDVVAVTLGIHDHSSGRQQDRVVTALASHTGLLVLDNCEQVIDAVAELVKDILARCPNFRILATSREALSLRGETVIPVYPLSTPADEASPHGSAKSDAVTLFAERAAASVPSFELTDTNSATVAQICERLDGLPLAIELAAARMRALSPEQILQRLTDRFALLTRGRRGAPDRQQTLRWSIGWSHDLCTAEEQQLWGELSLFAGGFELDAAEHVCSDADELLDNLSSLVDKSIVIREEADNVVRFRMLDTVRVYGREKIAATEEFAELQRRHRDWFMKLALDAETEWISPHQLTWSARLHRDITNLRQALEFSLTHADGGALVIAAALRPFWISSGLISVGRRWLDRALDAPGTQPAVQRAKAFYAICTLAAYQGDLAAANARAEQARALDAQQDDPTAHALVSIAAGMTALFSEDSERALADLHDAADGFDALGNLRMHIAALIYLGWAYHQDGQAVEALSVHEKALALAQPHGEYVYRTYTLWSSGIDVWKAGESDRATKFLEDGIRLTRRTDDPVMTFMCLQALSWIFTERGDLHRAAVLMGAADALSRRIGSTPVFFPKLTAYQHEFEDRVRDRLGAKRFGDAHREGCAMTTDAAIACALGETSERPAPAEKNAVTLTKRERQVAELIAEGLTNKAIAGELVISQRTAEGHVDHILTKLGFTSRAQVAAWVAEQRRERGPTDE